LTFDPKTGVASSTLTRYVVQSVGETRFTISGTVVLQRPDALVIRAVMPWRTDWLSFGLYDDGWTRPRTRARIRVFATPGQRTALIRTLTVQVRSPVDIPHRAFELAWDHHSLRGDAVSGNSVSERIELCVPAHGFAEVRLTTPVSSSIPGDQRSEADSLTTRKGGVLVADISLANEIGFRCRA
jgi:hypothetical protein